MSERRDPRERFRKKRRLGEGATGSVWLVDDPRRPGGAIALKELSDASSAQHVASFRREFATLACLHHPGLVEVGEFEIDAATGLPRFTLELIEGRNLVDAVRHEGPSIVLDLAVEALRALAFLHDFDLVHRDLKPANLLVRDRPKLGCRLAIVDFGLALKESGTTPGPFRAAGTLPYMAPEILANRAASRRSDLYALGAVIHEAIFGTRPPATAIDDEGVVRRIEAAEVAWPVLPDGFPRGVDAWLRELLAADPERRPSGAAEALALLNEACGTRFPPETPASRASRLLSGPPAEREASVEQIRRALNDPAGPRIVWLCGASGSGKTRILRWLEADAVLRGWPVSASLDAPSRGVAGVSLVLLDEVQTAPAEAVERLVAIARDPSGPLRVVAALRAEGIEQPALRNLLNASGELSALRRIELPPLDAAGVRAMACRATGGTVAEERVAWLLEACGGSPAEAEALLIDGSWERGGRAAAASAGRPGLEKRLSIVAEGTAAWLDALAVLRFGARDATISKLAGLAPAAARAAADEALAAGLAVRREGRWHPGSGRLGAFLLARMTAENRRAKHRAAAGLLAADREADPAVLAVAWAEAGETARAVACARQAAQAREQAGDPAGAAARYADALRFLGRARAGRAELRARHAEALARAGRSAGAARAWGGIARLAPDRLERVEARAAQAAALVQAGRFQRALRAAEEAARGAIEAGRADLLARARLAAGSGLGRLGREREAAPVLDEARRLFREAGDLRGEADALHGLAACRVRLGEAGVEQDFVEAIELYRRAAVADRRDPVDAQDLKAAVGLAVLHARAGRYDEAEAILEEARSRAVARGSLALQEVVLSKLALLAIDAGRLDAAMTRAEQAADLAVHLGDQNLILVNRCALADARIRCGRAGASAAGLARALEADLRQVEPENLDYARMLLADARIESAAGDPGDVADLLARTLAGCRARGKTRSWLMALVIEMERRARADATDPFEPVAHEWDAVAQKAAAPIEPEIEIRAALARAAFALTRGDPGDAGRHARRGVEIARDAGWPAFEARACARWSEALARAGEESRADEVAARGRALLDTASRRIDEPAARADFLARGVYAPLREASRARERRSEGRLGALYDMIRVLNSESDPDALLDTIVDLALRAVDAERGMVFLREERQGPGQGAFAIHRSRNVERETERDALSFSRRIVEAAGAGEPILALDAGSDERFRDLASVSLYRIRSLMCVPLRSRGRVIGTVYLDSRKDGRLFTPDDLRFVEAFADQAALAIENSRLRARLEKENRRLAEAAEARTSFANLVGRSAGIQSVYRLIEKIAATDLPVLIRGESGTGKELVARAIHVHGPRRRRPFLGENCAAIPESLLESELFGHVRGAFTGAERDRPGLFEQATGGTLFLDEVGDMSPAMQVRLLRVVEEGAVRPVGAEKPVPVDARLVTATHRDLAAEVRAGRFRQDLLYRLQVLTIEIPPLRERPGDVPLLAAHVLEKIAAERGRRGWTVDDDAMALLARYRWPGNVRELQNTLQRLSLLAGERAISVALIESDPILSRTLIPAREAQKASLTLAAGEREQIRQAIDAAGGNRRNAAKLLGVSRATLYRKLDRHGL